MPRKPLEPAVAAAKGLSPAERAKSVACAKAKAFAVVNAVRNDDAAAVQEIAREMGPQDVWALVIVLAEVADLLRLKAVKDITDDGMPLHISGGERRSA